MLGQLAKNPVAVEKVPFPPKQPKLGDTKCLENQESRLWGFLAQSFFEQF
jgi:hypothetical protein